jgi:hypothetical protein
LEPDELLFLLGVLLKDNFSIALDGEADLDAEIAIGLASPLPITLYQVGTTDNYASFNHL